MDLNALNGAQETILENAILAAFSRPELDALLGRGDRGSLESLVSASSFQLQVSEIVELSQRLGWTDWLVTEVISERPLNSMVKSLLVDLEKAGTAPIAAEADPERRASRNMGGSLATAVPQAGEAEAPSPAPRREDPVPAPAPPAPNPAGTGVGQWILAVAGVVAALGVLGGAVDGALNQWSFAKGVIGWAGVWGPDCDNYAELKPEEQEQCDMQH